MRHKDKSHNLRTFLSNQSRQLVLKSVMS